MGTIYHYLKSCRICLQSTTDLTNIFQNDAETNIADKIMYCASVQITNTDSLPTNICATCRNNLDIAYLFKTHCENSDLKLRSILDDTRRKEQQQQEHPINNIETIYMPHSHLEVDNVDLQLGFKEEIVGYHEQESASDLSCDCNTDSNLETSSTNLSGECLTDDRNVDESIIVLPQNDLVLDLNKSVDKISNLPLSINDEKVVVIKMDIHELANISKSVNEKISKSPVGRHIARKNTGQLPRKLPAAIDYSLSDNISSKNREISKSSPLKNCNVMSTTDDIKKLVNPRKKRRISIKRLANNKVKMSERKSVRIKPVFKQSDVSDPDDDFNPIQSDGRFTCIQCSKTFPTKSRLIRHFHSHAMSRSFSCKVCSKRFRNKYNLSLHLRIHTGQFPLKCDICERGFSNRSTLKRHIRTHTGELPFNCKYCGKQFPYENSLSVHEKIHIERPKYTCSICFKIFSYKNSLAAHVISHSGTKRFTCKMCDRSYTRGTSLRRHIAQNQCGVKENVAGNVQVREELKELLFRCKVCQQEFKSSHECVEHENKVHCRLKCDFCSLKFMRKTQLSKHLKIHNKWPCGRCEKSFTSQNSLNIHAKKTHKNE